MVGKQKWWKMRGRWGWGARIVCYRATRSSGNKATGPRVPTENKATTKPRPNVTRNREASRTENFVGQRGE